MASGKPPRCRPLSPPAVLLHPLIRPDLGAAFTAASEGRATAAPPSFYEILGLTACATSVEIRRPTGGWLASAIPMLPPADGSVRLQTSLCGSMTHTRRSQIPKRRRTMTGRFQPLAPLSGHRSPSDGGGRGRRISVGRVVENSGTGITVRSCYDRNRLLCLKPCVPNILMGLKC
ncbi:hypothetical protein HPP92_009029 [Vanilla planifolia]|uniref:Uncharacterized protein n=1 Tax=Vanilla planifolia TaxID=51239 RepID=A0A835RBK9_VANPL|nr:hypothetical protein HPP92_009029 [Vanilla planifolia]